MNESKLTKFQTKEFVKNMDNLRIKATVRYDDQCGNGHNTFAIKAETREFYNGRWVEGACGCLHEEIAQHFPELQPFIRWHLTSSDGPMHYVANTMYHAKSISKHQDQWYVYLNNKRLGINNKLLSIMNSEQWEAACANYPRKDLSRKEQFSSMAKPADLGAARRCAVWPDATLVDLQSKEKLLARLPKLLKEFRADMESLGFIW